MRVHGQGLRNLEKIPFVQASPEKKEKRIRRRTFLLTMTDFLCPPWPSKGEDDQDAIQEIHRRHNSGVSHQSLQWKERSGIELGDGNTILR